MEKQPLDHAEVFTYKPPQFLQWREVAGCHISWGHKFLLLKRATKKIYGTRWGIPGGSMETHESPLEAVVRELQEEIGWDIERDDLTYIQPLFVRNPYMDYRYHLFHYTTAHPQEITLSNEHTDMRWVTKEEALKLPLVPGSEDVLGMITQL